MIEEKVSRAKRFRYDPRAPGDRQHRAIYELDLQGLREATNGTAGILCYLPPTPDADYQEPSMQDCSVVTEIVVTAEETTEEIAVLLPPTLPEIAASVQEDSIFEAAIKPLSREVIHAVSDATKDQAESDAWFDYRTGRITASKLYQVSRKVNESGDISERNDSLIKQVMNYSPAAYSPAIHWGKYNEEFAVRKFYRLNRRKHRKMEIKQCGVFLCEINPIIAASPDALVSCRCCGVVPLEVKNPYKHRALSINKFAEQNDACLEITAMGEVKLKPNHAYYYQVQAQILATNADMGYFALKTASPYNNFHCEQILFDPMLLEELVDKATLVFKTIILPELTHGHLKKKMDEAKEQESAHQRSILTTSTVEPDTSVAADVPQDTATPSSSAVEFACSICKTECIDEPDLFEDMSIYCDLCTKWFHWVCVKVTGTEKFLKRKTLKWFCPLCQEK